MDDPLDIPPILSRGAMIKRHSARSDWQAVIDIQEWRWEAIRYNLEQNQRELNLRLWLREALPLLEAYLYLGKDNYASGLVNFWRQSPDWNRIKQYAISLAEKYGNKSFAERWK